MEKAVLVLENGCGVGRERHLKRKLSGERDKPEDLGLALARQLIAAGADRILEKIYGR